MSDGDKPVAVIELDAFCERCGFNLRSQAIWRDERLGILVCRCPECGQHQAATGRATMMTPWLQRAATMLTLAWVLIGLAFVAALLLGLFGMQVATMEGLTNRTMRAPDGMLLNYGGYEQGKQTLARADDAKTTQPPGPVTFGKSLVSWLGGPALATDTMYIYETPWQAFAFVGPIAVVGTYVAGAILASGSWFWRRGRRWAWLALPLLVAAVTAAMLHAGDDNRSFLVDYTIRYDHRLEFQLLGAALATQLIVLALGLWTGRSLARLILTIFAPPGVRQLFAFLWHCDGKTMPPANRAARASDS